MIVRASNQADYLDSRIAAGKLHIVAHGVDTDYFRPRSGSPAPPGRFASAGSWLRDFGALREIMILPLRDATANNALLEGMSCCSGCTQA